MKTQKITDRIDAFSELVGRSAAWLTLLMVLVMALIVVLRYVFQFGSIALQESVMYLNALIFTFGVAYTLKEQGHVRVDVFYNRLSTRRQALIDILGGIFCLLLSSVFIVWQSWDYVEVSWRIREGSPESSGLPLVYVLKSTIIVLPILLAIQGLSEILKSIEKFRLSGK